PFAFEDLRARLERYAVQRGRLRDAVVRGQADVDRVLAGAAGPGPAAAELPKGTGGEAARRIGRARREGDGTPPGGACAESTGVSRVSARRYLEHFHTVGSAEVSLRYGAAGRPERRYRFVDGTGARTAREPWSRGGAGV